MIRLIAITLVTGLLLIGCATPNVSPSEDILPPSVLPKQKVEQPAKEQPQENKGQSTPEVLEEPCADCPKPVDKQEAYTLKATPAKPEPEEKTKVVLPGQPPDDMTWISPGKVQVGNFHPGARAEWPIIIHNGNNTETSFSVKYRYPDHVGEEYWHPPGNAQVWVIVADSTPVLEPRETRKILIVLEMPEDVEVYDIASPNWIPPKWEFWISVIDTSQTGMVQTELCTRWLINMRS